MSNREDMINLLKSITDEEFDKVNVIDTTRYYAIVVDGVENDFVVTEESQIKELTKLYEGAGKSVEFRQMTYKETAFNPI